MKYVAPNSVEEAAGLLESDPEARVFAGATDWIPQIRAGRREPGTMVDLKRIERLVDIGRENGKWTIGAATPAASITADADFCTDFPGLAESAGLIGSDQTQNRASLGGAVQEDGARRVRGRRRFSLPAADIHSGPCRVVVSGLHRFRKRPDDSRRQPR